MNPVILPMLSVLGIYYLWRNYAAWLQDRHAMLRERVAYMLWMAARQVD
jgi:hypothetical protein